MKIAKLSKTFLLIVEGMAHFCNQMCDLPCILIVFRSWKLVELKRDALSSASAIKNENLAYIKPF